MAKKKKTSTARKKSSTSKSKLRVETFVHDEAKRKNIPTAEYQSIMQKADQTPIQVAYERRNRDLDPQLVWRGKSNQNRSELLVPAPPLYIQEKVHPKVLIDDLISKTKESDLESEQFDLFDNFNGLPNEGAKTEFYQHDSHWSNRMILGDALQVMTSLSEREGLRGKVQCVYIDPPYGIKFSSNFQWSTTSPKVDTSDRQDQITREPEQVRAFRDTWRDGIHSYLSYLSDRLRVAQDLLCESGCVIFQIGDENLHRVRCLLDEVFGEQNFVCQITIKKTHHQETAYVPSVADYLVVYAKKKDALKYRPIRDEKSLAGIDFSKFNKTMDSDLRIEPIPSEWRDNPDLIPDGKVPIRTDITLTQDGESENSQVPWNIFSKDYYPGSGRHWRTHEDGRRRLAYAGRVAKGSTRPFFIEPWNDKPSAPINNIWTKSLAGAQHKIYVVQTNTRIVEQALLSFTDPGDIVIDPTCGSGTTAYVSEQWGRRWITIDTSRVALALARSRIMGASYPYYLLKDSIDGIKKEEDLQGRKLPSSLVTNNVRHGFVCERTPRIQLKTIANNSEIDVIWEKYKNDIKECLLTINKYLKTSWEELEVPRDPEQDWPKKVIDAHAQFWKIRIKRQNEINHSIESKADSEPIYNKPYIDKSKIRVAGPFTVESVSPHTVLPIDHEGDLLEPKDSSTQRGIGGQSFMSTIIENLKTSGVQQAHKENKIDFSSIAAWPGQMICAEAFFKEESTGKEKRAAIFIGPEFGTVSRPDLVEAAREAGDADFDVLLTCAFNYDARSTEFSSLGRIPVLKARMNADLHMAEDLKNTNKGNLFVIFGEPDIDILKYSNSKIQVKINGVDVFHPNTGEVKSDGPEGIACWLIDTNYNEESFFVRHAYFLGANDPYKALKTSLKAEIDKEAWETLRSDTSRPFEKPKSGRIAVKVINHLGDEVMKVFKVD